MSQKTQTQKKTVTSRNFTETIKILKRFEQGYKIANPLTTPYSIILTSRILSTIVATELNKTCAGVYVKNNERGKSELLLVVNKY